MNANIESFLRQCTTNSSDMGIGEGLAAMFGGGPGGPGLPKGIDPKQMESMWKMLDDMAAKDPEEYQKFISGQMAEMKQEIAKEKKEEEKSQMITSEPSFSVRIYTARKVTGPPKDKKKAGGDQGGLKLFDFNESQIKESFIDNDEKADPIDEPKFYLNVLYHDNVLPPLNKGRDLADPKNDREWLIIPMVFSEPKQRKNLEGKLIITYDCHLNACVIAKMKGDNRAMKSISNYIVLKFQELIEDSYILHKKTIKFLKNKKYKCPNGSSAQIVKPFLLPKEHDARSFKQVREKIRKDYEEQQKQNAGLGVKKEDIKLTPTAVPEKKEEPALLESIKIPGQPPKEQKEVKKIVIQEMGKTIPNYDIKDEGETVTMTLNVEEESSAKDIDLDFSDTTLLLNSKNYELTYNFKNKNGFLVDPNSVKAKFNKKQKSLALTFTKVV